MNVMTNVKVTSMGMNIRDKYVRARELAEEHDRTLLATEPDLNGSALVQHQDGSMFFYNNAYLRRIVIDGTAFIVAFSEHNGYHVFFQEDLEHYRQFDSKEGGVKTL